MKLKQVVFIACGILLFFLVGRYITSAGFQPIKQAILSLSQQVPRHYALASFIFLSVMTVVLIIGLPLVPLFGVTGAFLFGPWVGFVYTVLGCVIASIISYFVFQFLFTRYMHDQLRQKYGQYEEKIKKHGASYLLMLQFLGIVPLSFINALAVFSHISLFTVFWTTLLGSLPLTLVYTLAGGQLRTMESLHDIVSWRMMGILVLCAFVALLPMVTQWIVRYVRKHKK